MKSPWPHKENLSTLLLAHAVYVLGKLLLYFAGMCLTTLYGEFIKEKKLCLMYLDHQPVVTGTAATALTKHVLNALYACILNSNPRR